MVISMKKPTKVIQISTLLLPLLVLIRVGVADPLKKHSLQDDYELISAVVDSVEKMKSVIKLDSISPFWTGKVNRQLSVFQSNRQALRKHLDDTQKILGSSDSTHQVSVKTVMRWHKDAFGAGGEAWVGFNTPFSEARDTLMEFANHPELRAKFLAVLGSDSAVNRLTKPISDIHLLQLQAGIDRNEEKIRRYTLKYGPASARLNLLEVALNYWALQGVPGIRSTEEGPGHLEVIASYNTAYLLLYNTGFGEFASAPTLTSVFEGGLRYYIFRSGWGGEGIVDRLIKPAYITFGGILGDRVNGFLRLPVQKDLRWGVFGSWGDIKVAFQGINDLDHSQLLVSRQFQFIPYLF
jgi:hypothetical protein